MERTIWTPKFSEWYNFAIYLDRDFALDMIKSKANGRQKGMNKLGKDLAEKFGEHCLNPYQFHEDSCFVSEFDLNKDGRWLSITNPQTITNLIKDKESKLIEYHSHNLIYSKEAYILMAFFGKWVEYAEVLKDA